MTLERPYPDASRFSPVSPEVIVQAYMARLTQAISLSTLQSRLRALLSATLVDKAVSILIERGEVSAEQQMLHLTPAGKASGEKMLGRDANEKWDGIKSKRLPLVALGLNPDDPGIRQKLKTSDAIKAAVITVAFALPKETMSNLKAVRSEVVWRVLRAGIPDLVGKGPFPIVEKPGPVERVLLAGLAGTGAKSVTEATDSLVARAVGLQKTNSEALRERLIAIGVERSENPDAPQTSRAAGTNGKTSFAAKVNEVASKLSTPPFRGRVAIAQVYDAYGKVYPDAGPLEKFKERLVDAAKSKDIQLGRLDLPERMGRDLRERSEIRWNREEVHFVITDWN
jgi:hypothetical protein